MSGIKEEIVTSTYFKEKKCVTQSSLFEDQLSSADSSLNEFKPKRGLKLKLKPSQEGEIKPSQIKTRIGSTSNSNSTQASQSSLKNSLAGTSKIKDDCSQLSVTEVGTVSKIELKACPTCGKEVEVTVLSSHVLRCLQRFQKACPKCDASLSKMSKSQAKEHIDRCKQQERESDSSLANVIVLDCPFCGKYDNNPEWRKSHMFKCAKSKKISRQKYVEAVELQEKQARERLAAGLTIQPAKPVVNPKTSNRSTSRRGAILEPTTYDQEDLQIAKAMSLSLKEEEKIKSEEENFLFQTLSSTGKDDEIDWDQELINVLKPYEKKSSRKPKKKKEVPLLFRRSNEDRKKIIDERVAELLLDDKDKFELPSGRFHVNWKDTFIIRERPNLLQHSRLWNLSTRADMQQIDKKNFYTRCFLDKVDPSELDIYGDKSVGRMQIGSVILGGILQSAGEGNVTASSEKLTGGELATQDVLENLLEQNYFKLEATLGSDEEMGYGFITQKEKVFTQKEMSFTQDEVVSQESAAVGTTEVATALSRNLLKLVDNAIGSDVRIRVDGDVMIACHRCILFARCLSAFQELKKADDDNGLYDLNWSDISYNGAYAFLKYLYAEIQPEAHCSDEVTKLAQRYEVRELLGVEAETLSSSSDSFNNSVILESEKEPESSIVVCGQTEVLSGFLSLFPRTEFPEANKLSPDVVYDIVSTCSSPPSEDLFGSSPPGEQNVFSYDSNIPETRSPVFTKEYEVREEMPRKDLSQSVIDEEDEVSIAFSSTSSTDLNLDSDAIQEKVAEAMSSPLSSLDLEERSIKKRKLFDDSDYGLNLQQRIEKRRKKEIQQNASPVREERVEKEASLIAVSPYEAAPNFSFEDDSLFERVANSQELDVSHSKISPKVNARRIFTSTPSSDSDPIVPTKKLTKSRKQTTAKKNSTPMPHYSIMETPEITKKLKSIGVKNLGKKKGTKLLKHIFKETHKDAEGKVEVEKTDASQSQSSSYSAKSPKKNSKKSTSESSRDLNQQIEKFIKSKKEIHQDILLYKPLPLESLLNQLNEAGIKCNAVQLKDFLDKQCLAFQSSEEKFARKKKTSPRKKKNTKS